MVVYRSRTISRNLKPAWLTEGHLVSESQIRVTATEKQTQGHLVGLRDALEISKVHTTGSVRITSEDFDSLGALPIDGFKI